MSMSLKNIKSHLEDLGYIYIHLEFLGGVLPDTLVVYVLYVEELVGGEVVR